MSDQELHQLFLAVLAASEDRAAAVDAVYQRLENMGLIGRVVVHRYLCAECGVLATVIRVGDEILCRTRDYKLSPGLNARRSVAAARRKNTLDGARHWPGHTFDVRELAEWGTAAAMEMNCGHLLHTELAVDVLAKVEGVLPGKPGKPTVLGASP
jgi:hypothetical protein